MTWLVLSLVLANTNPTDGGVPDFSYAPRADVLAEFGLRAPTEGPVTNAFAVPRVHLGLEVRWRDVSGVVLLEGVYSTQGGALIGVAGDSIVLRIREAWAGYRWRFLEARLGVIPTLLVPELEQAWGFRQLAPTALETYRLLAPADLGGVLKAMLPDGYGWLGVTVTNGEGYTSRELNPGKNLEVVAAVHPAPRLAAPLTLVAMAGLGSTGLPESATQRFGGAALWSGQKLGLSLAGFAVSGLQGDSTRRGLLFEGAARGVLLDHLLLAARAQYLHRDVTSDDAVLEVLGGVGARIAPLEVFLAASHAFAFGVARTALVAFDATEARLVVRVRTDSTN